MAKRLRLGVLISGSGSNLQAIIDEIEAGRLAASVEVVISNRAGVRGLERAARHGAQALVIDHRGFACREDFDRALVEALTARGVELVVLAGFMRLVTPVLLNAFPQRVMNIHPALLPAFPGEDVQQKALEHGVRFSGCTVHFVDQGMDTGPIIIQAVVPVLADDDAAALASRILEQEHKIYPRAIQLMAEGRLRVEGRRVFVLGADYALAGAALANPPLAEHPA